MDTINFSLVAGAVATVLFATSTLPMVVKAYRTKDLKSYSLSYLLLGNAGNFFYSFYVFSMPPGPIWLLHSFYLLVTGLMLVWYLRYEWWPGKKKQNRAANAGWISKPPGRRQASLQEPR